MEMQKFVQALPDPSYRDQRNKNALCCSTSNFPSFVQASGGKCLNVPLNSKDDRLVYALTTSHVFQS